MTVDTQSLLKRLDEIGLSLERSGHGLALLGLGSVGLELDRIDAYSDLDFFAIVEAGLQTGVHRFAAMAERCSSRCLSIP